VRLPQAIDGDEPVWREQLGLVGFVRLVGFLGRELRC
jgi:hypothetical protein